MRAEIEIAGYSKFTVQTNPICGEDFCDCGGCLSCGWHIDEDRCYCNNYWYDSFQSVDEYNKCASEHDLISSYEQGNFNDEWSGLAEEQNNE